MLKRALCLTEQPLVGLNQAVTVPLPSCRIKKHDKKVPPPRKGKAGLPQGDNIQTEEEGLMLPSWLQSHLSLASWKLPTVSLPLMWETVLTIPPKMGRLLHFKAFVLLLLFSLPHVWRTASGLFCHFYRWKNLMLLVNSEVCVPEAGMPVSVSACQIL